MLSIYSVQAIFPKTATTGGNLDAVDWNNLTTEVERINNFACATFRRSCTGGAVQAITFEGASDGAIYSPAVVISQFNDQGMTCVAPWVMMGCSTATGTDDEDEQMTANSCIGDENSCTNGDNTAITIRCCKL